MNLFSAALYVSTYAQYGFMGSRTSNQSKIPFSMAARKFPLILDLMPESFCRIWRKMSPIISKSFSEKKSFDISDLFILYL